MSVADEETAALSEDALPTGVASPDARKHQRARRATTPPPTGGSATTVSSPLEALERDEVLRTRLFCLIGVGVAVAGTGGVLLLPGDPTATAIVLSAVGLSLVAIIFLWTRTSDPMKFRRPATAIGFLVPALGVTSALPFYGVFSPAPVVLVLGIYFTSLGKSSRLAWAVYAVCAGTQAILATLIIGGWVRDTGLIRNLDLTRGEQIITQLIVQAVLAATLVTARMSRRTALLAVSELERAVRTAAHREALLLEAREELERAQRAGRGRFSEQTLGVYHLGDVLGRGAMGEVYAAVNARGEQFAIKVLSQASLGNPNHVARFMRELETAAGLESPNIVKMLEVGDRPVPYLVMERLEGKTLAEILRNKRALSNAEVVTLVREIGVGITAAAARGIVHRDLKPQNVFLHKDGSWKVLDFGVARGIDQSDTLTQGHVVGTPSYMAPEQAGGASVDHCTDLYALAAIAYRALTGQPPFAGGELAETLYRVVHSAPRRPTELSETLPEDIDRVLAIGLAKKPRDRFASAAELADALARAFDGRLDAATLERGEALIRGGGWKAAMTRASTKRLKI